MEKKRTTKVLVYLSVLVVFFLFINPRFIQAQETCDEEGFLTGTYCPCPDLDDDGEADPEWASLCGLVSDANITQDAIETGSGRAVWSTRKPVSGVTVAIYENHKDYPTGQPFGALGGDSESLQRKLVECVTSEEEGKYHCLMRRLNPGNRVYVIFSCGGKVADVKIVPSVKSYVGLDSDVDCSSDYTFTPLPQKLEYAERDKFLGCSTDTEDPQAGYEDFERVYASANIGELGGDIRFSPANPTLSVVGIGVGSHPGALWENDCLIRYDAARAREDHGGLSRSYAAAAGLFTYGSVNQKCNRDVDGDGDGAMPQADELTVPFRYDIPEFTVEDTHRVWETRSTLQREVQDPRAFAQYNHLMFGECVMKVYLRYNGDTESEDRPIPCRELIQCNENLGDPKRNTHTALSFGSRLEQGVTWEDLLDDEERDSTDIVCHDPDLGDVTVAEVQPPFPDDPCTPGNPGCRYKLSREYYLPQFFIAAGSVTKPKTSETYNDAYGMTAARDTRWEGGSSEATNPHAGGHHIVYTDESSQKTNSGISALRIASNEINPDSESGIQANRFINKVDAVDEVYEYNASNTVWDVGGDVRSLCSASGVNDVAGGPGRVLPTITPLTEAGIIVDNDFVGDKDDHREHKGSASTTHATAENRERDAYLLRDGALPAGADPMFMRDYFDTALRFASGEGTLEAYSGFNFLTFFGAVAERFGDNIRKSFGERTAENLWTNDTPSYIKTQFCIAEQEGGEGTGAVSFPGAGAFEDVFPAYPSAGYPGEAGNCYPWNTLETGRFCDVWPGAGNAPENELRTCKLTDCRVHTRTKRCDEFAVRWVCSGGVCRWEDTDICFDRNGDGRINIARSEGTRDCNDGERRECLVNQEDTWGRVPDWPSDPRPPRYSSTSSSIIQCDLAVAGPMNIPGDIKKDHAAFIDQEPFNGGSQFDADPVSEGANYTALSLLSKVEERSEYDKASFVDYATSNDLDGISPDRTTHALTAGSQSQGFGTGATVGLLKTISHPERFGQFVEPFFELCSYRIPNTWCFASAPNLKWYCDIRNPSSWCYAIQPPGPIDLDDLDGGACSPNTTGGSCPIAGEVGSLAQRILGAAGAHSNVNGSLLLAVIHGEGGWLPGSRMGWDDRSIASYSEPWYARIPQCNDQVFSAQGPFGMITNWFKGAVENGGHHPSRVSPTNGEVVVSKCNFIDAAYAAAEMLSSSDIGCGGASEAAIRRTLTAYRGGTPPTSMMVDIAMHCR